MKAFSLQGFFIVLRNSSPKVLYHLYVCSFSHLLLSLLLFSPPALILSLWLPFLHPCLSCRRADLLIFWLWGKQSFVNGNDLNQISWSNTVAAWRIPEFTARTVEPRSLGSTWSCHGKQHCLGPLSCCSSYVMFQRWKGPAQTQHGYGMYSSLLAVLTEAFRCLFLLL